MAVAVEVRDTEHKGNESKEEATKRGIDLPEKIRFPVDRSWWAWARAQDRIREIGAYNPSNDHESDAIETAKTAAKTAIMGMAEQATKKGIDLPEKIRFPIESMRWARGQDRTREIGAYTSRNDDKSDAIETAKNAVRKAINGMAAHWRMAFTAARTTEAEGRITAVSLNVLNYPKLPTLSNGDPSFSLDWVAEHEDGGLYVSLTIKTGRFAGLPVEVNFDKGQLGRPGGTISDRWGDTYPIEPYPVMGRS